MDDHAKLVAFVNGVLELSHRYVEFPQKFKSDDLANAIANLLLVIVEVSNQELENATCNK